jgi:hypothetical protein
LHAQSRVVDLEKSFAVSRGGSHLERRRLTGPIHRHLRARDGGGMRIDNFNAKLGSECRREKQQE